MPASPGNRTSEFKATLWTQIIAAAIAILGIVTHLWSDAPAWVFAVMEAVAGLTAATSAGSYANSRAKVKAAESIADAERAKVVANNTGGEHSESYQAAYERAKQDAQSHGGRYRLLSALVVVFAMSATGCPPKAVLEPGGYATVLRPAKVRAAIPVVEDGAEKKIEVDLQVAPGNVVYYPTGE
jgi:hypothetical protein